MGDGPAEIPFDMPCENCGYNLRAANVQGRCPECGKPIWETLQTAVKRGAVGVTAVRLRDRPPEFLSSLRVAAWLATAANSLALLAAAILIFGRRFSVNGDATQGISGWILAIAAVLAATSLWGFGRCVQRVAEKRWVLLGGWIMGGGALAYAALLLTWIFMPWITQGLRSGMPPAWVFVFGLLSIGVIVAGGVRLACVQWWLRLEGWHWVAWGVVGTIVPVAFVLFFAIFEFGNLVPSRGWGERRWAATVLTWTPLVTNAWPAILSEVWHRLDYSAIATRWGIAVILLIGQVWVIVGDAVLGWLGHRALVRRRKD